MKKNLSPKINSVRTQLFWNFVSSNNTDSSISVKISVTMYSSKTNLYSLITTIYTYSIYTVYKV
jgi:hypothetical protein